MLPRKISRWVSRQAETRQGSSLVARTKKAHLYVKREQSYTDTNLVLLLELIRGKSGEHCRRGHQLTAREREVLFWIDRGKSNAEIGTILGIAAATVGKHLERIYPKLGVENRTAAATFAFER